MAFLIPLNIIIPIGLVVVILIVVAWVILFKNKKLYKNIASKKQRFDKYQIQLKSLQKSPNPQKKDFERLNKVARAFFKEYLNLNESLTYLELEKTFKKQNKTDYAKFCRTMSDANYQGTKTSSAQIKQLISMFNKMLEEYK